MVRYIANVEEWDALMEVSKTKLVVADFTATWYVLVLHNLDEGGEGELPSVPDEKNLSFVSQFFVF